MGPSTIRGRRGVAYNFEELYVGGVDILELIRQSGANSVSSSPAISVVRERYVAVASGVGYGVSDIIVRTELIDVSTTPTTSTVRWDNFTTNTSLSVEPVFSTLALQTQSSLTNTELRALPVVTTTDPTSADVVRMGNITDLPAPVDGSGDYSLIAALKRLVSNSKAILDKMPASVGQALKSQSSSVVIAADQEGLFASATNQQTEITRLTSLDTKIPAQMGGMLPVTAKSTSDSPEVLAIGAQTDTIAPVDGSGSYSIIAGLKRSLVNWVTLLGKIPDPGQRLKSGSIPVVVASDNGLAEQLTLLDVKQTLTDIKTDIQNRLPASLGLQPQSQSLSVVLSNPTTASIVSIVEVYTAIANGIGYVNGDVLRRVELVNTGTVPATSTVTWTNVTSGITLAAIPNAVDVVLSSSTGITDAELRATPLIVSLSTTSQTAMAVGAQTDTMAAGNGSGDYSLVSGTKRMVSHLFDISLKLPSLTSDNKVPVSVDELKWVTTAFSIDNSTGMLSSETQTNGVTVRHRTWTNTVDGSGNITSTAGAWV